MDIALGARIKLVREQGDISQSDIADALGVTFQQVQKYENGSNRISFGKLCLIAVRLGISVTDLISPLVDRSKVHDIYNDSVHLLQQEYAQEMLAAFCRVENSRTRKSLVDLIKTLSD